MNFVQMQIHWIAESYFVNPESRVAPPMPMRSEKLANFASFGAWFYQREVRPPFYQIYVYPSNESPLYIMKTLTSSPECIAGARSKFLGGPISGEDTAPQVPSLSAVGARIEVLKAPKKV